MTTDLLAGKRLLITGVVNTDSIAYATAVATIEAGAKHHVVELGPRPRAHEPGGIHAAAEVDVVEADLTVPAHLDKLTLELRERWGNLDGALHAIAFAPREALSGDFLQARLIRSHAPFTPASTRMPPSLRCCATSHLRRERHWSDSTSTRQGPGPSTTGWASASRRSRQRTGTWHETWVKWASAPTSSRPVRSILERPVRSERSTSSLRRGRTSRRCHGTPRDATPVADAATFLLSDLARMITGEILHVDGGFHAMAGHRAR